MTKERIVKLQEFLERNQGALIINEANRFYFTGFETSDGVVFITKNKAYFLVDFRYIEKAKETVNGCEVIISSYNDKEILDLCKENNVTSVIVEADSMSVSRFEKYKSSLEGIEFISNGNLDKKITDMRSVKSENELKFIKQAQIITDETFNYIINNIAVGRTEKEIMLDMEFYMRKLGSEGISFDFIVVSGKNSSLPHGVPTDKKVEKGDFVTMDFGAVVNGYRSDMTRTVAVGNVTEEQKKVYDTVLTAQLAAIDKIKSGCVCKDIDKVARDIIYSAGYEGCFGHGLGHSVGIEIHERPNFNMSCDTILKVGNVMTVEPGIYIENKYGVRIEDMVYVTENGCINITESNKNLIII